jgi:hypothetical protein
MTPLFAYVLALLVAALFLVGGWAVETERGARAADRILRRILR